jgi:hypothetical protein
MKNVVILVVLADSVTLNRASSHHFGVLTDSRSHARVIAEI